MAGRHTDTDRETDKGRKRGGGEKANKAKYKYASTTGETCCSFCYSCLHSVTLEKWINIKKISQEEKWRRQVIFRWANNSFTAPQKVWPRHTTQPSICTPTMYQREMKICVHAVSWTWKYTAASFLTVKRWKQPKCSSLDKRTNTSWWTHSKEYYSATEKKETWLYAATWMTVKNILLSEIN